MDGWGDDDDGWMVTIQIFYSASTTTTKTATLTRRIFYTLVYFILFYHIIICLPHATITERIRRRHIHPRATTTNPTTQLPWTINRYGNVNGQLQ